MTLSEHRDGASRGRMILYSNDPKRQSKPRDKVAEKLEEVPAPRDVTERVRVCSVCGKGVRWKGRICHACQKEHGLLGVPSQKWPEWAKYLDKNERQTRVHDQHFSYVWRQVKDAEHYAPMWANGLHGWLRWAPYESETDNRKYRRASDIAKQRWGRGLVERQDGIFAEMPEYAETEADYFERVGVDDKPGVNGRDLKTLLAYNELAPEERAFVIVLVTSETQEEAADRLGVTQGAVSRRLARIKQKTARAM